MYRIRLATGAETTYHSIDELTAALQDGTVTAEAVIYHQRADRWLTITNHPHYQIALSRAATGGSATATQSPAAASASPPKEDGSKRQVISAVRPLQKPVPQTRVAPRTVTAPSPVRTQLNIPAPKKAEAEPVLRAQENVLEGVVIDRPKTAPNSNGNGNVEADKKTAALPVRSAPVAKPVTPSPVPRVPDLDDGLDLVDDIVIERPAAPRATAATPQVDKLLEMLDPAPVPAPPVKPVRALDDVEVIDLNAPIPIHPEPLARATAVAPSPPARHQPSPTPIEVSPRAPQSRGNFKMFGLAAGAVLVIGAVLFLWKPWASRGVAQEAETVASAELPRTEAFGGSTANPAPTTSQISGTQPTPASNTQPAGPVDSAPSIVRVAAPRNLRKVPLPTANLIAANSSTLANINASTLIQHYNAAYTDARSELELRMLQIGFTQIFLRSRLANKSGVQDTRRLITSANGALREYRSQETQIERAYGDTIGVAGRNLDWTPRDLGSWNAKPSQKEAAETLRLTNLMLSQMDSTFSLLAEQEGKYQISGEAITFQNSEAARQYGALRVWLNQQADKYSGSGDALPATLRQVVKAIGATRLPQERR